MKFIQFIREEIQTILLLAGIIFGIITAFLISAIVGMAFLSVSCIVLAVIVNKAKERR